MRLPDFEAWAIFAKVAEFGSFARAADDVQLSRPTVSKAVSRLEQSLGVALFHRNSRHLSLTQTGQTLLAHANRILVEAQSAEVEARGGRQRPSGRVRMAAPMTFGIRHLAPVLPAFMQRYPDVDLSIDFSDAVVDLVADGYDVALRIATLADSSLRARSLCSFRLLLVAAPAWLDKHGRPDHPRALEAHKGFVYTNTAAPGIIRLSHAEAGKEFVLAQRAGFGADNSEAFLPCLEAGLGYGLFPEFMVWDALRDGRLECLLPQWHAAAITLYLVTPASPLRPMRVMALLDYLENAFANPPWSVAPAQMDTNKT
ncbi:LysR family transcriptional regulator [Acetobacter lambici]|uniref:LysR family transcriptional regulator n=1 Tax=Acetobacter lambici TaxID=1332824 RepID=A0ABT1F1N8_9PROT|nr:LysR family transcriptional regulator [Acetobacter lambici]MCP1242948.1 LysR family transcriptional regulator [Acetobacter lambici]MCP1259115.1 LysR family transcriptional regulator [Acetobacter lambici]NHO57484.1 LysR family transcriptional regulator [Acetobacter lambici]